MGLRGSFAGGVAFGVLAVAGAAAFLPVSRADDRPRDVRLLVACDEDTKPKVLVALRGLDVVVHDLATMRQVAAGPARAETPSVSPIPNALEVWTEAVAVVDAVRRAAGPDKTLTVGKIAVQPTITYLSGFVGDVATFDALDAALRGSERLGKPRADRGPLARDPKSGTIRFDLSFPTPPAARVPEAPKGAEEPSPGAIRDTVQRAGATVRTFGAVEISAGATGERRSVTVQLEAADPETVVRTLREVATIPGVLVSGVVTHEQDGGTRLTFKVTITVPR